MAAWHYAKGDERFGPIGGRELKGLAESGRLLPADLIWKEGMGEWRPAREAKGLFPEPQAASPAEPPPLPKQPAPQPSVAKNPAANLVGVGPKGRVVLGFGGLALALFLVGALALVVGFIGVGGSPSGGGSPAGVGGLKPVGEAGVAAPKAVGEEEREKREKRVVDQALVAAIRKVKGKGLSKDEMEAEFSEAIRGANAENAVRRTEEPKVGDTYKLMYTFVFKEREDFEKAAATPMKGDDTTDDVPVDDSIRPLFYEDGSVVRVAKIIPGGVEVVFIAGEHKGETGFMTHMLARYAARVNRPE